MSGMFGGLLSGIELIGRAVLQTLRRILYFLIGQTAYKFDIDSDANRPVRLAEGSVIVGLFIGLGLSLFIDWHIEILLILGIAATLFFTFFLERIRKWLEAEAEAEELASEPEESCVKDD